MALTCGCVGLCRVSRLSLSMRTWRVSENRTQPYTPPLTCGNAKQPYTARLTCKNTSQHHATAWRWLTVGPTADAGANSRQRPSATARAFAGADAAGEEAKRILANGGAGGYKPYQNPTDPSVYLEPIS